MRSRWVLGLAFAASTLCGAALSSLAAGPLPVPSKPRYVFQRMGEDVLGARTITALRQDREGFLWVGTSDGLFRFDGATLVRFGASEGLEGDAVTFLAEAPDGTLFAVTNREVSFKKGDRFVRLPLPVPPERRRLRGQVLAFDARGRIYVATAAGLLRFQGTSDAGALVGGLPEGQDPRVTAVTVLKSGAVVYFAGNDVFQLAGDGALPERLAVEGGATGPASALLEDASGRVILRTSTRLYRREKAGEPFRSDDVGLPGANDLGTVSLDRRGEPLVPTPVGLYVKRMGRWEAIDRTRGLASNAVLAVCEDREGALWIGYGGGGLERWPGRLSWSAWTTSEGLPDDVVWAIARDGQKRVVVGTNDGVGVWDPERDVWRSFGERDGLQGRTVRRIAALGDGSLLLHSVPGNGLTRYLPDGPRLLPVPSPVSAPDFPASVETALDGTVLLSTRERIFRVRADGDRLKFEEIPIPQNIRGRTIQMLETRPGLIWSAGRRGLARFADGQWRTFSKEDGVLIDEVSQLATRGPEEAWLSYDDALGITRLTLAGEGTRVKHFTERDGVLTLRPYFLGLDAWGRLFAGSENGLTLVTPDDHVRSFRRADGLFWDDLSADAMLAEPDGSVFFGTSRGLVRYDPSQDMDELPPLTLALTSMRFGSQTVTGPGPHEVPFSGRTFVAQFAAMTFREPLGVTFRYVLEGLESDPVETRLREARYFTLPAGTYTFQVTARSLDGRVSQAPASVTFTILPPWWQTLPFRIAVAGLLGLLGFGIYRLRVAQLVKGQRELETLVESRTRLLDERNRELQDAVQQLSDAQKRILSLEEALPERLDDAAGGVLDTARDIGRMVGSESVGVYEVQGESIATLTSAGDFPVPTRAEIECAGSRLVARPGPAPATLVPVLGPSREAHGAVLVPVALDALGPLEKQLLEVFARHLGTTLELRKMRRRLRVADAERVRSLADLEAKGIDTLRECPRCGRCFDHRSTSCEVDGQPLLAERILPFRIGGRYRLMRFLGEGGMGAVFKANDERLGRHVAVKIVRAEYLHDPTVRARLEREARLVARINHPGVVQLHDSGQLDDGSAYLVMEFLPGLDLSQMLDRFGAGTPEQVARVIAQVGDALEAAHAVGVIHRDLKPANLFLVSAPNGFQVKVVDFGLAKSMAGEGVKATRTGFVVGSPLYMSPEQVKDLDVDGRSDLFALASLSYELLTNMPAFGGTNVAEIFTYIMQRTPIALTASLKGARPELDKVFFEALEKSPDRRPRRVGDWVSRVVPLLQEVPSHVNGWPMAFGTQSGFLGTVTPH